MVLLVVVVDVDDVVDVVVVVVVEVEVEVEVEGGLQQLHKNSLKNMIHGSNVHLLKFHSSPSPLQK